MSRILSVLTVAMPLCHTQMKSHFAVSFQVEVFDELARIFSEDNNQWAQRELLMREGTAKFADTVGEHDKQLQKLIQRQANNSGVNNIDRW